MNITELNSGEGFAQFLKAYHQHLNKNYKFPALSGFKPMHRAAEVLGFSGGEELSAAIDKYSNTEKEEFFIKFTSDSDIRDKLMLVDDLISDGKQFIAKGILDDVLKVEPDNIDALTSMAWCHEAFNEQREAYFYYLQAVQSGLLKLGSRFSWNTSLLPWGYLGNRPLIRSYFAIATIEKERGNNLAAAKMLLNLVHSHPNDNIGARDILFELLASEQEWIKIIDLFEQYYSDAGRGDVGYTYALALFAINELDKANKVLEVMVENTPLFKKELLKKRHPFPKDKSPWGGVTLGSHYEAYLYWEANRDSWNGVDGALEWLSKF